MTRPEYYGNPAGLTGDIGVVRAIYDAFARRDLDAALARLAPGFEFHAAGTAKVAGRSAPYQGHDGMRQYFADAAAVWDDLVLHAEDFRVLPGSVIVIGHVTARRGEEQLLRSVVWTWKVKDGLATSVRVSDMGPLGPQAATAAS